MAASTSRWSGSAERAQLLLLEGKMPRPMLKFVVKVGPSETRVLCTTCQRVLLPNGLVCIDDEWSSRMYTFGFTRVAAVEPLAHTGALSGGMKIGLQASPGPLAGSESVSSWNGFFTCGQLSQRSPILSPSASA